MVFIVCLGLSSFLWILNSLEKRYTSKITVPVSYVEFPKDKLISGSLPSTFDLMVDAYGYTLLSYKWRLSFSPIILNINELAESARDWKNINSYSISTVNHKEEIEKQISSEIRILSIKPDSLIFNFSKLISKKIPVKPNLKLTFEKQYSLESFPLAYPDSVLVSGPKNILDTLRYVNTVSLELKGLAHSVEKNVFLQNIAGLKFETKEVHLTIPIEQNTEVSFEIPVQILNAPADAIIKTFPGKIRVACIIGLSKYQKLDEKSFRATINYLDINNQQSRLTVSVECLSKVVLAVNYSPKEVEYIVEHGK